MKAMQLQPARRFTVPELAKLAGASRANFARLFSAATGKSPMRFLTELRLRLAAYQLVTTPLPLARIARNAGYASEFSLSRAFKRHYGFGPAHYRRAATPVRCAA